MKQTCIIVLFLVIITILENYVLLKNKNKVLKVYKHVTNSDPKKLLPKYGFKYFKPIRINYVHTTDKVVTNYKSEYTNEEFLFFKKLILEPVDNFFKKSLKLFPLSNFPKNLIFTRNNDKGVSMDFDVGKHVQDYDYVFFLQFEKDKEDVMASAINWMFVNLSHKYLRPLAGEVSVNTKHFKNLEQKSEFELHELRRVFYHEIIHALAFGEELFEYFVDSEGKPYNFCLIQPYAYPHNKTEFFIQHPKIKQIVAEYYNCRNQDLNIGFPLSNFDKSHFHQQISYEEIMRPFSDSLEERTSKLLIALLEITGWYIIPKNIYYNISIIPHNFKNNEFPNKIKNISQNSNVIKSNNIIINNINSKENFHNNQTNNNKIINLKQQSNNLLEKIRDYYIERISNNKLEEKTLFGRNKGCNFVNLYCHDENGNLFEEYCDVNKENAKQRCNFYYEAISYCRLSDTDSSTRCPLWYPLDGGNCKNNKNINNNSNEIMKYGQKSKCFDVVYENNVEDAICLEAFCDKKEKVIYAILDGVQYKTFYVNDRPNDGFFYSQKYAVKINFPKSFERFCFLEINAKNPDKGFKK